MCRRGKEQEKQANTPLQAYLELPYLEILSPLESTFSKRDSSSTILESKGSSEDHKSVRDHTSLESTKLDSSFTESLQKGLEFLQGRIIIV